MTEKLMPKAMPISNLYTLAINFLQQHKDEHLDPARPLLVERCTSHLIDAGGASFIDANDTSLQALGELDSRGRPEYVDMDKTTSFALFLNDREGRQRVFTIAALMDLIYQAESAGKL